MSVYSRSSGSDSYSTLVPHYILHNVPTKKKETDWRQIAYIAAMVVGGLIAGFGALVASGALPTALLGGTLVGPYGVTAFGGVILLAGGLLFWFHRKNK